MHVRKALIGLLFLAIVGGVAYTAWPRDGGQPLWVANALGAVGAAAPTGPANLVASGIIEAERVTISAEVPGRIETITVDEGDEVKAGQPLVTLDRALLEATLKQADAGVATAEAAVAQVKAGARPEDIHQAEVALSSAAVARDVAQRAWQDAVTARDNPQELDVKIEQARGQLAASELQIQQANLAKDAATTQNDSLKNMLDWTKGGISYSVPTPHGVVSGKYYPETGPLETQVGLSTGQWWSAWETVNLAVVARDGAQRSLDNLLAMRDDPLTAQVRVDAAKAQFDTAEAQVGVAAARLEKAKAGATTEQVAVAEARLKQARAARATLETQINKMTLSAPSDGLVVERAGQVGEMALSGVSLLEIADLNQLELTVYVAENRMGLVTVGRTMSIAVDSYPDRVFDGTVRYVSPKAEFTPKNVQTEKERVNLVYAVRITLPNLDHALKPGMSADATFPLE